MNRGLHRISSLTHVREKNAHSVYLCLFIDISLKYCQSLCQILEKLNSFPFKVNINKTFNFLSDISMEYPSLIMGSSTMPWNPRDRKQ